MKGDNLLKLIEAFKVINTVCYDIDISTIDTDYDDLTKGQKAILGVRMEILKAINQMAIDIRNEK